LAQVKEHKPKQCMVSGQSRVAMDRLSVTIRALKGKPGPGEDGEEDDDEEGGWGFTRFVVFSSVLLYIIMLVVYAWERKRGFQEYNRCMTSLHNTSKCLHGCIWCWAAILGRVCWCSLKLLEMCCLPIWTRLDSYSTQKCPVCWASTRRKLQFCAGCCWYTSGRAVIAADGALNGETAQRLKQGTGPKQLKEEAKSLIDSWAPDKLPEAVNVLERASNHIDGWREPFKKLRQLLAAEIGRQIENELSDKGNYAEEAAYFITKRKDKELGKEAAAEDEYQRGAVFKGSGPMERVSALLGQLEQSGGSLADSECKSMKPVLNTAAKRRLNWGMDNSSTANHKPLQYALFCAGTLRALELPDSKEAAKKYKEIRGLPEDWNVLEMLERSNTNKHGLRLLTKKKVGGNLFGVLGMPGTLTADLQQLLDDTFIDKFTRDRKDGEGVPNRLVLVGATMVQNEQNWIEYARFRDKVAAELAANPLQTEERHTPKTMNSKGIKKLPKLRDDVQEVWLYHGTSSAGAEGITSEDFRLSMAGSAAGTLYGRGIYLAEACSKSDEYTKDEGGERHLLLCRAVLGRINYTDKGHPNPEKLEDSCLKGKYHSVLGDREKARGTYREFMVYDDDLVYPAYIIKYRRQYYTV